MKTIAKLFLSIFIIFSSFVFVYADEITVTVDGQRVIFTDQPPVIVSGRTLIPVRGVFEMMGYYVGWDDGTSTASIISGTLEITVQTGDDFITANGNRIMSDVPPQIISGRFMIPLRLVAEATGAEVDWDGETRTATITTTSDISEERTPPTITMCPYTIDDIEASEHGYSFVRGEIVIIGMMGVSFNQMADFMEEHGGEIVGFLEVPNTYQVYFHNAAESELRGLIELFNADSRIIFASLNLVSGVSPNQPSEPSPPSDSPLFEVLDVRNPGSSWPHIVWLVGEGYILSPEYFVFRSVADIYEFVQAGRDLYTDTIYFFGGNEWIPAYRETMLADFDEEFFRTRILLIIAYTERSTAPVTHIYNVTADEDTLHVEMLTTFPSGTIGGGLMVSVFYIISIDNSLDRDQIHLYGRFELPDCCCYTYW